MTVAGLTISGAQAGDYTLTQPTTTGNITPAPLTVSGITASNKVYDASTDADVDTLVAALARRIQRRFGTLGTAGASGTFTSENVGTGITVTVIGLTISGAQARRLRSGLTRPRRPTSPRLRSRSRASRPRTRSTMPAGAATVSTSGASLVGVLQR